MLLDRGCKPGLHRGRGPGLERRGASLAGATAGGRRACRRPPSRACARRLRAPGARAGQACAPSPFARWPGDTPASSHQVSTLTAPDVSYRAPTQIVRRGGGCVLPCPRTGIASEGRRRRENEREKARERERLLSSISVYLGVTFDLLSIYKSH